MKTDWTADDVKRELPLVQVRLPSGKRHGDIVPATVSGRRNGFASVTIDSGASFEFAWSTIARCLNGNRPLIA